MSARIIGDAWETFERQVLAAGVSSIQRQETRRAFYAGAVALFSGMASRCGPSDEEPTAAELTMMDDINNELIAWGDALGRGEV